MGNRDTIGGWWRCRLIAVSLFCLAGLCLAPVGRPAAQWQRENQPALHADELGGLVGQGALLGVFGGFRSLLADFTWVRSYALWEKRERAGNEALMRLAITLDPGNTYFWLNAADVIAYDQSHWEIRSRSRGGRLRLDPLVEVALHQQFADAGIALLETGAGRMPSRQAQFYVRAAQICATKLKDMPRAAEFYRRAAECDNPAWYAGVIYLEIMSNVLGKQAEALAWGRAYEARLAEILPNDPLDIRQAVLEKIQALESR